MTEIKNSKQYDLEERTLKFARRVRIFVKELPKNIAFIEDISQLVRASGSVGANYIEANESLGRKDFIMRIKICRKEVKEAVYWLNLLEINGNSTLENEHRALISEGIELMKIFGAIFRRAKMTDVV